VDGEKGDDGLVALQLGDDRLQSPTRQTRNGVSADVPPQAACYVEPWGLAQRFFRWIASTSFRR
jgi:hypothetical protein